MAGLIGYWKFDEGAGTTVADSSNSGHIGILTGTSWQSGRDGTYGVGLTRNRTNYVEVSGSTGLTHNLKTFSVCAWARCPTVSGQSSTGRGLAMIASKITVNGWDAGQGWLMGQKGAGSPSSYNYRYFGGVEFSGGNNWIIWNGI